MALTVGLVLLVATLLAVLDEADYRRILVWSADVFMDSELVIKGPLSVTYSAGDVRFSAQALRLAAYDGSYSLNTNALDLHFRPASVLEGPLLIDELALGDFVMVINEPVDGAGNAGFSIPLVVIARAHVDSLDIEYQEAPPGTLHRFRLDNLIMDDAGSGGPVKVQATGVLEDQDFRLDGVLPPLDSIQDRTTPKPIRLDLVSGEITASLAGNIADPFNGKGMNLKFHGHADNVDKYLEVFWDGIPSLGKLEMTAMLRGDYEVPRLEQIDFHVSRGEDASLTVNGEVANARTGEGARLRIAGRSDSPAVLSWLLFREHDRLSSVDMQAALEIKAGRYFISGLDVDAKTPQGLNLFLGGGGEIFAAGHKFSKRDAGFKLKMEAPKTSTFNMLGRPDFPDLGPVAGNSAIALGLDAVGLFDTDISIGSRRGTHVTLQGDIGYIPLAEGAGIRETGLMKVNIGTVDLARLGRQLGYAWPKLGRMELSGELGIENRELQLGRARLSIGEPDRPLLTASGNLATELNKGSSANLDFDVAVAELVAAFSDRTPAPLGQLRGSASISDMDGSWGIEKISLASSDTNLYRLEANGVYDDLVKFDGVKLNFSGAVDDMPAFGKAIGTDLSGFGSYRAEGLLQGSKGKLSYQGKVALGTSTGDTELDGVMLDGKPQFTGKIHMPVLNLVDFGLRGDGAEHTDQGSAGDNGGGYVFSREPLEISFLNSLNLELDLLVDEVPSRNMSIDSIDGHVSIRNGYLKISPFHLNFEGGRADVELGIRDAANPEYRLSINGNGVKLGSLLAQVEQDVAITGSSDVQMDLEAKGRSPHELAAALNGKVRLELENALVPNKYIILLSADVLGWVGSKSLLSDKYARLNCVVMSFDSSDGMVASNALIADGPKLTLGGRVDLDLGKETLDIVLVPKEKYRIFSSISPVKITGPMNRPHVEAIPAKAAVQEIGSMALMPGVVLSVKVFEKFWEIFDEKDKPDEGCSKLLQAGKAAAKE